MGGEGGVGDTDSTVSVDGETVRDLALAQGRISLALIIYYLIFHTQFHFYPAI